VRPVRNAYAAVLLVSVLAVHVLAWLPAAHRFRGRPEYAALYAAVAGAVAASTGARRFLSHASTFAHELAHCVSAVLVGASPRRITYQPDSTGLAVLEVPERVGRYRRAFVFLCGYFGPCVAASTILSGLATGRAAATLVALATACAAALLLLVRNLWGAFVTGLLAASCWLAASRLSVRAAEVLLGFPVGVLLVLGVADAWGQYRLRQPGGCDAASAAAELHGVPWRFVAGAQAAAVTTVTAATAYLFLRLYALVP